MFIYLFIYCSAISHKGVITLLVFLNLMRVNESLELALLTSWVGLEQRGPEQYLGPDPVRLRLLTFELLLQEVGRGEMMSQVRSQEQRGSRNLLILFSLLLCCSAGMYVCMHYACS
jgi:hypothetical protein